MPITRRQVFEVWLRTTPRDDVIDALVPLYQAAPQAARDALWNEVKAAVKARLEPDRDKLTEKRDQAQAEIDDVDAMGA